MIQRGNDTYYKVGLHIHTTLSDGHKTPEEVAQLYRDNGYDAIAITDHWRYGSGGQMGDLLILSGCEYNNRGMDTVNGVMHLVGFGMTEDPELTRENSGQQIVDAINRTGGLAVLAHPGWSLNTVADAKNLQGLFATEIYNAVSEANQSLRAYSDYFADLCANEKLYLPLLATDDAHYYDGSDACMGWVMVRAASCSREDLLAALRAGDFYASQGPELYVTRQGNTLEITCSPCSYIGTLSNLAWARRVERGENLTSFTYTMKETERWVRVQVRGMDGKMAWSNFYLPESC